MLPRQRSATLSDVSDMTTSEMVSPTAPDTIIVSLFRLNKAAIDVLDRHEIFHEGLMRHLAKNHPTVEPGHRFPLIIGATTKAQLSAKCAQYSSRGTHRGRVANNAAYALSYWNFALRLGTKPTATVFHGPGSLFDDEKRTFARATTQPQVTSARTKMLLPEFDLPVFRTGKS